MEWFTGSTDGKENIITGKALKLLKPAMCTSKMCSSETGEAGLGPKKFLD